MKAVKIEDRWVGEGHPCFVVAEAGVNHDGDIGQAMRLVDAAASAGADAVKFQAFKAEKLATPDAPKAAYQARATDASESQYRMLKRLELSEDDHRKLSDYCRRKGILFLSTPYDEESADFLSGIGIPAFKVSSGDLTNHPFLEHLAGKGKPVLLSTGMSSLPEVGEAIGVLRKAGAKEIVLLHAVSCYPADPADVNLKAIRTLSGEFDLPVGYSDHTLGVEVACAAVALGACMIEKHVTLDRNLPGPDHRASLEPGELETLVRGIRIVEKSLGDGRKEPAPSEMDSLRTGRKSIVSARDIPAGAVITREMLVAMRPGGGVPPGMMPSLVGKRALRDIPAGTPIRLEMIR